MKPSETIPDIPDILEHFGVKGQRWGVRRRRGSGVEKTKRETGRTKFAKPPKNLTSAELDRRIKRMETEKRYNELNKRDVGTGEKMVVEVLTNVGKNVATKLLTGAATYGAKKGLEAKFGAEIAAEIAGKKKKG